MYQIIVYEIFFISKKLLIFCSKSQFFIFFTNEKRVYQILKSNHLLIYLIFLNLLTVFLLHNILFRIFSSIDYNIFEYKYQKLLN